MNPKCLVVGAGLLVGALMLGLVVGVIIIWWRNRPRGPRGGVSG